MHIDLFMYLCSYFNGLSDTCFEGANLKNLAILLFTDSSLGLVFFHKLSTARKSADSGVGLATSRA
jgi:hypothetical protein